MVILFQMVARISGFMILGAILCITSVILYLDFYISDPIFNASTVSQKPIHYLSSRFSFVGSSKNQFHQIHFVNVQRTSLIQSDEELNKDDNISSPRINAPSRLLKQAQVPENYTNTEINALGRLVVAAEPEQKAVNKVETSTPFGQLVFDYENTYVYEDESVSSQRDSPPDGNSWLYRVPDQTHRFRQHNVAKKPKALPKEVEDDAIFEDWKELEAIAQKTVQKDKNAVSKTEPEEKHADSEPVDSKKVHDASLKQRTGKIRTSLKINEGNNDKGANYLIDKVSSAVDSKNISKLQQLKSSQRKLPNTSKKSSNGIDMKQDSESLPKIAAINITEVKRRYKKANRTDVSEELYRLAPDVSSLQ